MSSEQIRFTDPAFTCEVTITGTAEALYKSAQPQFDRLKEIKSIGVVSHTTDMTIHTRHQHLVGMLRIFNKLCQQQSGRGLPKKFLWSHWCALCFDQNGHAALGYDSEKAVILACHMDLEFKNKFQTFLTPIFTYIAPCTLCDKQCSDKQKDASAGNVWFEEMIKENKWWKVHSWVSALKLIQNGNLLNILNQQRMSERNSIGFSQNEAFKMLICPECEWGWIVKKLNRLDYVVRDLAFTGTIGIQVDVDGLIARVDEENKDWAVLQALDDYLSDTIYEDMDAQTKSVLYQRALATQLIKGKITLEQLFGTNLDLAYNDEELIKYLSKFKAGKEIFDPDIRNYWKTWPIKISIDDNILPSDIEKAITGQVKNHLLGHTTTRVTCVKLDFGDEDAIGLSLCHKGISDRPEAKSIVNFCKRIQQQKYEISAEGLNRALYEILFEKKCGHGMFNVVERLAILPIDIKFLKEAATVIRGRVSGRCSDRSPITFKIGEKEYPFSKGSQKELVINQMHATIFCSDAMRKKMEVTIQDAAKVLWYEILFWQSTYFGRKRTIGIDNLLREAQRILAQNVRSRSNTAESDLEVYTLLESLLEPDDSVTFRLGLPNLKLYKNDGKVENEYDVVSVILKENKNVEIWIWGVTTESEIESKRRDDQMKIQKLKNSLGDRWEGDIRTQVNYIHMDNSQICCEIDGRQTKRS